MREILTIHVGQAGINIGDTFWKQLSKEHDIDSNGQCTNLNDARLSRSEVYFNEPHEGRFAPRAIFTDLDSNSVNTIRASNSQLYNPNNFISQNSGARNNWAIGHYTRGRELLDQIMEAINKEIELCDSVSGFQIFHSISGGSGSGMGTLIMDKIQDQYSNQMATSYSLFPEPIVEDNVVAPYNATFSAYNLKGSTDLSVVLDNMALSEICFRNYNSNPSFQDYDNLISQGIVDLTACYRFPGQLNSNFRKMAVNTVPFLRMHFFSMSNIQGSFQKRSSLYNMIDELFQSKNQMCSINLLGGRFISNAINFRGDIQSSEVEEAILEFKRKNLDTFVEWIPNNHGLSICNVPSKDIKLSATALVHTTTILSTFQRLQDQFSALFRRKAYVHWYTAEGMDELEFRESVSTIQDLATEYQYYQNQIEEFDYEEVEGEENSPL